MQSSLTDRPIITSDIQLWLNSMRYHPESYQTNERVDYQYLMQSKNEPAASSYGPNKAAVPKYRPPLPTKPIDLVRLRKKKPITIGEHHVPNETNSSSNEASASGKHLYQNSIFLQRYAENVEDLKTPSDESRNYNINEIFDNEQRIHPPIPPRRKKRSSDTSAMLFDTNCDSGNLETNDCDSNIQLFTCTPPEEPIYERLWELQGHPNCSASSEYSYDETQDLIPPEYTEQYYQEFTSHHHHHHVTQLTPSEAPPEYRQISRQPTEDYSETASDNTDDYLERKLESAIQEFRIDYLGMNNENISSEYCESKADSSSPPPYHKYVNSCEYYKCFHPELTNKRQGIDFEYFSVHNEDSDIDDCAGAISSSTSTDHFNKIIHDFQYEESMSSEDFRIYENVPLIPDAHGRQFNIEQQVPQRIVSLKKFSFSAPNLCFERRSELEMREPPTEGMPLCTAEEVEITFERTSVIRKSSLLTPSTLDLLSEHVTPRKASVSSDIIAWTYSISKQYCSETEICPMEEKPIEDYANSGSFSKKSLTPSPVVLRKGDDAQYLGAGHEVTRAKSFVQLKTNSFHIEKETTQNKTITILWEALIERSKIIDEQRKHKKWLNNTYGCLTKNSFYLFPNKKTFELLKAGTKDRGTFDMKIDLKACEVRSKSDNSTRKNLLVLVDKNSNAEVLLQDKHNQEWSVAITQAIQEDLSDSPNNTARPKTIHDDRVQSNTKEQKRIRDVLRQFFGRRPPVEQLIESGIYKVDLVFGGDLTQMCETKERPKVPVFVVNCIQAIEENLDADGLYRASGNVSQVNSLRLEINQNNYSSLSCEKTDIHVLAGVLKLFFRELSTSVIPSCEYDVCLEAVNKASTNMFHELKISLSRLPIAHLDTLKYLIEHLMKVADNPENRMDVSNLAMMWGPNLIQYNEAHTELNDMYFICSQQMKIMKIFMNNYVKIFEDL